MVTVQDIGLQLTKPVRELAQWHFPFAETLEQYCSLFNSTCNNRFSEAGLVLQNSTAVYVHRIDSLWTKTEYCRNVLSTNEQEEATTNYTKKRDGKTDACFHKFKTVNFAKEVDKNINLKKNHATYDSVKTKSRRFTQLEKGIGQHVSIDIYDVNGEVIGKKYDFRCNQNISMNGILVDEFAPQDFCCNNDVFVKEKPSSSHSCNTSVPDSIVHDDNNENVDTIAESERGNDSQENESSDLIMSLESSQQNLSLSSDIETDDTLVRTPTNISGDSCCDMTFIHTPHKTCPNTPTDTMSSPIITNIDSANSSNNNDSEDQSLNNNIKGSIDVGSILDSPPESVNSKGRRTSSINDPSLLNGDLMKAKFINSSQSTLNESRRNKTQQRSILKSTSKSWKQKLSASYKRRQSTMKKNLLHIMEDSFYSRKDRPNMFKENLRTCMKCIREYDPLRYKDVMNEELDFLGFRLHVDTEPEAHINKDVTTNVNNNVTTSIDKEIPEFQSSSSMGLSFSRENFCDTWFRSSHFSSDTVEKWHEMIQPKLRDTEQRSTFCIRDYTSRIMETLKASSQRKISFDAVIQNERPYEVARYFLASLDLASKQNIDINTNEDPEHNIEIALHEDRQSIFNSQADPHD